MFKIELKANILNETNQIIADLTVVTNNFM